VTGLCHLQFLRLGMAPVLVVVLLLSGCERDTVRPEPRLIVTAFEVGTAVVRSERKINGRVVPADLTRVAFRIPGKITHLPVQAGQQVVKGQVLAQIESSIQQQVLADAQAQYQLSRRQLQRAQDLFDIDAITPAQRDELNAGFRLAGANLELARAQLAYTTVEAPFDGTVAEVGKDVFETVAPGETVIAVYRNDRIDVLVDLPDSVPAQSTVQDKTVITAGAVFSGDPTTYTLAYLKNAMARSPESQAFQFWLWMPASDRRFPPGLPVTLTFDLGNAGLLPDSGLGVPLTALQATDEQGQFQVWRYEDGVARPVPVGIGRISQQGALVTWGLQAGDRVITSGLARLFPGREVVVQPAQRGAID
jgi:RND family efflux transporter MFP subunit